MVSKKGSIIPGEFSRLDKIRHSDIEKLDSAKISGDGYVVHSLEASIWCLLTTATYEVAVMKVLNLCDDPYTTGSITGAWQDCCTDSRIFRRGV